MKITYVYADNLKTANCSIWDCIGPAEAINREGTHQASIMHINQFQKNLLYNKLFSNGIIITNKFNKINTRFPISRFLNN